MPRPPKTSWDPCARCGDPDGPIMKGGRTPARIDAAKWGLPGKVCSECYRTLRAQGERAEDYSDLPEGVPHTPRAAQIWRGPGAPSQRRKILALEFPEKPKTKIHEADKIPVLVATFNYWSFKAYKKQHEPDHPEISYFDLAVYGMMYDMTAPIEKADDWESCPALADPIFAAAIARGRLCPSETQWVCNECGWEGLEAELLHWRAMDHVRTDPTAFKKPDGPAQCPWCERSDRLECREMAAV